MSFADDALTDDAVLGGRVRLRQPAKGYRAATDPVLLAAAVAAEAGEAVLDAGCGAGAAALCLAARTPGLRLHGLEMQADYAALARLNAPEMTVWEGDLFAPPAGVKAIGFDWVISNPPFFDAAGAGSPDPGRDAARREAAPTADWVAACLRRARSGGRVALIHRAEKLGEALAGLAGAGDIAVLPLAARAGRSAKRVIVTARKGAKGPLRLLPPFILHAGARHERDGDDFTAEAVAVLRDAAPLAL